MKIKTKSGFTCEVNEKKIGSWNLIDLYTQISDAAKKDDEEKLISLTRQLYVFGLGEEGYQALCAHVADEDGIIDAKELANEFKEVMNLAKTKKVKSSQG